MCVLVASVLSIVLVRQASAHAILLEASPAVNATVSGPNVPVSLRFNSRIDGARSRLTLVLPDGSARQLEIGAQPSSDRLTADATGLAAGHYKLR